MRGNSWLPSCQWKPLHSGTILFSEGPSILSEWSEVTDKHPVSSCSSADKPPAPGFVLAGSRILPSALAGGSLDLSPTSVLRGVGNVGKALLVGVKIDSDMLYIDWVFPIA